MCLERRPVASICSWLGDANFGFVTDGAGAGTSTCVQPFGGRLADVSGVMTGEVFECGRRSTDNVSKLLGVGEVSGSEFGIQVLDEESGDEGVSSWHAMINFARRCTTEGVVGCRVVGARDTGRKLGPAFVKTVGE
jgi:hypothetical protein